MTAPTGDLAVARGVNGDEERLSYPNKLELILTLVGYAVGLGNVWRFPYLVYTYGGGAFLIPYFIALVILGVPLFALELGLGQMFRQGTLGVWRKLGLSRMQGVGRAATLCTFFVSLYYNVILAWTLYYIGRTLGALAAGTVLPWDDAADGFVCPETVLFPNTSVVGSTFIVDAATGIFNTSHRSDFWCPAKSTQSPPPGYGSIVVTPSHCPARAAVEFWERQALQQSSGMDDLGGVHWGLLSSYTVAWLLVYLCICKGIASSGKVVYFTAVMPYVALVAFFVRAITLPNALEGVRFFVEPDFGLLLNGEVWIRAVTQIFYSLGVGFGSLVAFASYGQRESDFVKDAATVSIINCGTSILAGFVVFPILGFLAHELSAVDPCIQSNDLGGLSSVGLAGHGLAFVAFPIAISQMTGGFFWAVLFFVMLLCLGIDSQFAMVESIMTVLSDLGIGRSMPRPAFVAIVCFLSYVAGLVFVTRGGVYWFLLFDYYTSIVAVFFVTAMECFGLMWADREAWPAFADKVKEWTGRQLDFRFKWSWKFVCPVLLAGMCVLAFLEWDLMGAGSSVRYPQGTGYLPAWSVWLGWALALLPIVVAIPIRCAEFDDTTCAAKELEDDGEPAGDGSLSRHGDAERGHTAVHDLTGGSAPGEVEH